MITKIEKLKFVMASLNMKKLKFNIIQESIHPFLISKSEKPHFSTDGEYHGRKSILP